MARIVQKFGGTSVANTDRIKAVALRVKKAVDAGDQVAVVLSAMSGETNKLVDTLPSTSDMANRGSFLHFGLRHVISECRGQAYEKRRRRRWICCCN